MDPERAAALDTALEDPGATLPVPPKEQRFWQTFEPPAHEAPTGGAAR